MNPCNPTTERTAWLRWQISDELNASIAPGIIDGDAGAARVLAGWLIDERERLVSHCQGAMNASARHAGIAPFTREDIVREIDLIAWAWLDR